MYQNTYWFKDDIDEERPVFGYPGHQVYDEDEANLISSLCEDGWHRPVIDIDLPVKAVTSTNGGTHLFIDKPMTFGDYLGLLCALAKVGIVEWGYYYAVKKAGMSQVRVPGVAKAAHYVDTGNPIREKRSVNTMPLMHDMHLEALRQRGIEPDDVDLHGPRHIPALHHIADEMVGDGAFADREPGWDWRDDLSRHRSEEWFDGDEGIGWDGVDDNDEPWPILPQRTFGWDFEPSFPLRFNYEDIR